MSNRPEEKTSIPTWMIESVWRKVSQRVAAKSFSALHASLKIFSTGELEEYNDPTLLGFYKSGNSDPKEKPGEHLALPSAVTINRMMTSGLSLIKNINFINLFGYYTYGHEWKKINKEEDWINFCAEKDFPNEHSIAQLNETQGAIKNVERKTAEVNQGDKKRKQHSALSPLEQQVQATIGNWRGKGRNIDITDKVDGFSSNKYHFDVDFDITIDTVDGNWMMTVSGFMTSRNPNTQEIIHENVELFARGPYIHRHATLTYTVALAHEFSSYGVIAARFYELNKCNLSLIAFRAGEDNCVFTWIELIKTKPGENT